MRDEEINLETKAFIENMKNENTKRMTASHMRIFKDYLITKSEMRAPEEIDPKDLGTLLAGFYLHANKLYWAGV